MNIYNLASLLFHILNHRRVVASNWHWGYVEAVEVMSIRDMEVYVELEERQNSERKHYSVSI